MGYVTRTFTMATLIVLTVCQSNEDLCSYQSRMMDKSMSLVATKVSGWSTDDACRCVVSPNFNSSAGTSRLLSLTVEFQYDDEQERGSDARCLPMIQVEATQRFGSDPLPIKYSVCPRTGDGTWHQASPIMYRNQEIWIHIYNPGQEMIQSKVAISEFDGTLNVQCEPYERIMYEENECPCKTGAGYGGGAVGKTSEFNEKRRLTIGLVTTFVFLAIVAAVVVGYIFYKRRRAKRQQGNNKEAVTVENKAYQGSKSSVASEPKHHPTKDPVVAYSPDPHLNLKLQKPGHHGSKDSGLASSNDNNDKRLPFMQPTPAGRSLDNINALPENYPSLAGQGSTSSLDNAVDPVYVTRPGRRPSPGPGPEAGHPQNWPPLAGQGSQSNLDQPPGYPGDVDVLYAKLKRRPQQPEMSKSDDRLNVANAALAKEEQYHSAQSLNASRVTIETDI